MKIAAIDLNNDDFWEDYSYLAKKYGGGRVVNASFLERYDDFHIYANSKSFLNVREDKKKQCHSLSWGQRKAIKDGELVSKIIPEIHDYDLVLLSSTDRHPNLSDTKCKLCVWSPGKWEGIHPLNKHLLLFCPRYQMPRLESNDHIIHKIVLGVPTREFEVYNKEDFIFQCSRQGHTYSSQTIAGLCLKYGVTGIFAGPLEDQSFLDFIDNKTTFYLGEISAEEKNLYYKRARLVAQLQNHIDMVSLTAKESLSYGVGILCYYRGEWKDELTHNKNAFFVESEQDFVYALNNMRSIDQKSCWEVANKHSEDEMVRTCLEVFDKVVNENI